MQSKYRFIVTAVVVVTFLAAAALPLFASPASPDKAKHTADQSAQAALVAEGGSEPIGAPTGACCCEGKESTECIATTLARCNAIGGNYRGNGTNCADKPCPEDEGRADDRGGESRTTPRQANCPTDLNGDGDVNVSDMLLLLGAWGACDDGCAEDLNGDGLINVSDLLLLLSQWGECADRPAEFLVFKQLNWIGDCGQETIEASAIARAEITLSADDPAHHEFLIDQGGRWINIVLSANGGEADWVVQNLYLAFPNLDHLDGGGTSVQFRMPGTAHGDIIESVMYSMLISPKPVQEMEIFVDTPANIHLVDYLVGGTGDQDNIGGSGCSIVPFVIGNWRGLSPDEFDWVASVPAWISVPTKDLAEIDEKRNHCAPGSVARSVQYLVDSNDNIDQPTEINDEGDEEDMTSQDIAQDLAARMKTTRCWGTFVNRDNVSPGKEAFVDEHGMPIENEWHWHGYEDMPDDLLETMFSKIEAGCDVEVDLGWNGGGGHMAMVTSIVKHVNALGVVTGYTGTYVDDPTQDDGTAENQTHSIHVGTDGRFDVDDDDEERGRIRGMLVECPEDDADG